MNKFIPGWTEVIEGMAAPEPGGDEVTRVRREALATMLRMMDCSHPKGSDCDHVDMIRRFSDAYLQTCVVGISSLIRGLPRPLNMRDIDAAFNNMVTLMLLPSNPELQDERRNR